MIAFDVQARLDQQFAAIRLLGQPIPKGERSKFDITQVKKGGFIRLQGKVYRVVEVSRYQEASENFRKRLEFVSTELTLFCVSDGTTAYVEWDRDDEITVWLGLEKVRIADIFDGSAPLDTDDLDDLTDPGSKVSSGGKTYHYDDDYPVLYERQVGGQAEKVYLYEFVAPDGDNLVIEEWQSGGEESYEASRSVKVDPRAIEVISLGQ